MSHIGSGGEDIISDSVDCTTRSDPGVEERVLSCLGKDVHTRFVRSGGHRTSLRENGSQ